jgi:hypothetical protein
MSGMITRGHQKESLSRAMIQAIAGRCGMTCSYADFDYGIDVVVNDVTERSDSGKRRYIESGFSIAIQAKSTTEATVEGDAIIYDLAAKNYNDLRDVNVGTPRILVLLVLPQDESEWVALSEQQLIKKRCIYWHSLKGEPPTTNQAAVRIRIPRANLLNVESLQALMQRRKEGLEL